MEIKTRISLLAAFAFLFATTSPAQAQYFKKTTNNETTEE